MSEVLAALSSNGRRSENLQLTYITEITHMADTTNCYGMNIKSRNETLVFVCFF